MTNPAALKHPPQSCLAGEKVNRDTQIMNHDTTNKGFSYILKPTLFEWIASVDGGPEEILYCHCWKFAGPKKCAWKPSAGVAGRGGLVLTGQPA